MTTILEADGHDSELKNGLWVHVVVCPFRSQAGKRFAGTKSLGCCDKNKFTPNDRRRVAKPGISIFHFTFFVSLHSTGGFPCGATPVPSGPRHWPPCFIGSNAWPSAPPGNNDPIAAKRNAKDQGAMFRQKNIFMRRGCPVSGAFSTRLARRISQASIDTANPYSFRT